ncbi:CHRD domain-containing protein [Polaromonas sp. P1-6]|nr:CHRD domain-containing protein [Polaromonas sp. P1-6]
MLIDSDIKEYVMKYLQKIHVTGSVKWALAGALALALVACGFGDDSLPTSTTTVLAASLSGDQEVPPTITGALGTGTLSLVSPSRHQREHYAGRHDGHRGAHPRGRHGVQRSHHRSAHPNRTRHLVCTGGRNAD